MEAIKIDWKLMGAKLANMESEEQGEFFSGFASEFDTFESHVGKERQLLFVKDNLNEKVINILKKYLPCLWYDSQSEERE